MMIFAVFQALVNVAFLAMILNIHRRVCRLESRGWTVR